MLKPLQAILSPPPGSRASLQAAYDSLTGAQREKIETIIAPRLRQQIQNHAQLATGTFKSWREIISDKSSPVAANAAQAKTTSAESSSTVVQFGDNSGNPLAVVASVRVYHPAIAATATQSLGTPSRVEPSTCCHPIGPPRPDPDRDADGLPDSPSGVSLTGGYAGDLETALAQEFMPNYFISTGEQQQFATFGDYVPWTVVNTLGTNPNSYYHVTPLGLGTDASGNQIYAIRVDYLSLWNADGGLVGGGGACLYSYLGIDGLVQQLTGHELDAERSVMLLAAPAVNNTYNPDPNAYSLYAIYTAAHEGTFFDQSELAYFTTPVPAGNHVNLYQSLSKHSTYSVNPDYRAITPGDVILSTFASLDSAYADDEIDEYTYFFSIAVANDIFYGCLVERFGNQEGTAPNPISNVGEVAHPLNGNGFIQDNSARALNLSDKLHNPVF